MSNLNNAPSTNEPSSNQVDPDLLNSPIPVVVALQNFSDAETTAYHRLINKGVNQDVALELVKLHREYADDHVETLIYQSENAHNTKPISANDAADALLTFDYQTASDLTQTMAETELSYNQLKPVFETHGQYAETYMTTLIEHHGMRPPEAADLLTHHEWNFAEHVGQMMSDFDLSYPQAHNLMEKFNVPNQLKTVLTYVKNGGTPLSIEQVVDLALSENINSLSSLGYAMNRVYAIEHEQHAIQNGQEAMPPSDDHARYEAAIALVKANGAEAYASVPAAPLPVLNN